MSVGKKLVQSLKALVQPFRDELKLHTEEDEALESAVLAEQALAERERAGAGLSTRPPSSSSPSSSANASAGEAGARKLGQRLALSGLERARQRCRATYALSLRQCQDRFADSQVCFVAGLG